MYDERDVIHVQQHYRSDGLPVFSDFAYLEWMRDSAQ